MKINIDDYVTGKTTIQNWYIKNGEGNKVRAISLMGASFGIPCIVIGFWIGEITDWHPDVLENIDVLYKTYGYTEIVGVPEGCPWRKE